MGAGTSSLLDLLDLESIEVNLFRGQSPDASAQRVFGGQVAAQALVAAGRTVEQGNVHSLHSYFLRPGDPTVPILYDVDRIRDGRSFTTRRVVAIQHGQAIFNLQCSFHRGGEDGLEHQASFPSVPPPDSLAGVPAPSEGDGVPEHVRNIAKGLELRFVSEVPWERGVVQGASERLWLRFGDLLPDEPLLHAAVVTFASDLTLVDTVLRRHGLNPWDSGFVGASLDHCMWFHRAFRADEWLLYDQHTPSAHGARGFATGTLFSEAGELVATVAQEGLVRFRRGV